MNERPSLVASAPITIQDAGEAGLVTSLLSISKTTRAFLSLLLTEIDLHPGQDQLLHRLVPGQPVSVSALADQLAVRPSTVSKMLDRLIEKQLVNRSSNATDARRTMVMLTPAGEAARDNVRGLWDRLETELAGALPEADRQPLLQALQQIDGLLTAKLRRLR
ncbi:MarR family winged helix-turn-helix transcriptional regulator [Aureimonas sp. AU4]|uniref:MarR family winged helix-turn-helix transcriptional regulator n=1 Tax=Aureimonas sp. AU4 TaxID=1638163 RepID=UPI000B294459|nr:MarR family winged helix-turn-helix transcriptional regulator [Aureimonas sp. AU4]